jgi:uncharacterized Zn finger protein
MAYGSYKPYESIAVKKARAARSIARLQKKKQVLSPVQITGRKLARTWWGIAWNENLERYADYVNRIERGRSYVRQDAVIDLKITPGQINSKVQGTRVAPYTVQIDIQPLKANTWKRIVNACTGHFNALEDLVSGRIPSNLAELFTARGDGLFPSPSEIGFHCSCPDWAELCKHVAATLYGVGARLDEDPTLFFTLRQIDIDELITDTLQQASDTLLTRSEQKSRRSLDDTNLSELFGIDLTDGTGEAKIQEAVTQTQKRRKEMPIKSTSRKGQKKKSKTSAPKASQKTKKQPVKKPAKKPEKKLNLPKEEKGKTHRSLKDYTNPEPGG